MSENVTKLPPINLTGGYRCYTPDMQGAYHQFHHPKLDSLGLSICYLCDNPLSKPINSDHIIPDSMFPVGAEHRPQLPVHKSCNDKKTLLDERFKHRIQLVTHSASPIANREIIGFLTKVNKERNDAFIVGKQVRNYKLAKTLVKDMRYKMDIVKGSARLVQVDAGKKHASEIKRYASYMAKGLFIRNVADVKPKKPKLTIIDKQLQTKKQMDLVNETFKNLLNNSRQAKKDFGQVWEGYLMYIGMTADEKNAGMIWIEFYNSYIITALFAP